MSELSVYYNTIYMIEWLPAGERKTGAELYEQTIRPYVSRQEGLFSSYRSVFSKQQLFDTLDSIVDECFEKNVGRYCILNPTEMKTPSGHQTSVSPGRS